MSDPLSDEEFGHFGEHASRLIDFLFPNSYKKLIIISPSFCDEGTANVYPQFCMGDFVILSSACDSNSWYNMRNYRNSQDFEATLECHRFEHAILACTDMSVLTAWAQAEYAVMAFRGTLLDEFGDWLGCMRSMGVVRQI